MERKRDKAEKGQAELCRRRGSAMKVGRRETGGFGLRELGFRGGTRVEMLPDDC